MRERELAHRRRGEMRRRIPIRFPAPGVSSGFPEARRASRTAYLGHGGDAGGEA